MRHQPICGALAAALLATACVKSAPTPGGAGDPCLGNQDCAAGFVCSSSHCVLPANLGGCEPGRLRCNGADVERCADNGLSWGLDTTCATGCVAGACRPPVCTPGARRCEGDASEQCTPAGDTWALVQVCPAHCDSTTGQCKAPICTPFAVSCSADQRAVLTCDSFGAAQASTPCATGQVCEDGRCVTKICTPGARRCEADSAEVCAASGEVWLLSQVCPAHCDPGTGQCKAPICTPFSVTCSADNSAVLTCDSFGAAQASAPCAAGQVCEAGRCVTKICAPATRRCDGDAAEQCAPDGESWALVQVCPSHCDSTTGLCKAPICTPFGVTCSADKSAVLTCDSFGAVQTASPCGAGQVCESGRCVTKICTPGARRCDGDAAEVCAPGGDAWALSQVCASHCDSTTGLCKAPICTPFAAVCSADLSAVLTCDSFGAAQSTTPCASGQICDSGRCLQVVCAAASGSAPAATRCASGGASKEICNPLGTGWLANGSCDYGCALQGAAATCLPPACAAGAQRCSPTASSAIEACLPDRTGWGFVGFCATGCDGSVPGVATCKPPVCAPLLRRCDADGVTIDTCLADGSGWAATDTCPQSCQGGSCVTSSANCAPGELRCNGPDVQQCAAVPGAPGVTAWSTQGTCLAGCLSGACQPGGSCSAVVLHAAAAPVPGDGQSSVLVYSDTILGSDGAAIPDGHEFTLAVSSAGALPIIASADADPALPGVQVLSSGGRIHFSLRAPLLASGSADLAVTASAALAGGPSCAGSAPVAFSVGAGVAGLVLVAEDFTTAQTRNTAATSADWNTGRAALVATWPQSAGDGGDGALAVTASNSPLNLTTAGYAPSFAVLGLGPSFALLDGVALGLSGGDEVILWDAQGSTAGSANAGSWELLTVASVSGSRVDFTNGVVNTYGAAADQDVASQKVQLQRVPHLSSLSLDLGTQLTANGWDGTKGGLLFFRVAGQAKVLGDLTMDGKGFRGGSGGAAPTGGEDATGAPGATTAGGGAGGTSGSVGSGGSYGTQGGGALAGQVYGLPLLGRLFLGAGGGGSSGGAGAPGGGVVVLSAGSLVLDDSGLVTRGSAHANGCPGPSGCPSVGASSGGGAGGSVWLSAPDVLIGGGGPAPAAARGGSPNVGGAGRIRADLATTDSPGLNSSPGLADCGRAQPACRYGVNGLLIGQSSDEYALPNGSPLAISEAQLLLELLADGAVADTRYSAAASANDPPDFGALGTSPRKVTFTSSVSPVQGNRFRWKAALAPKADAGRAVFGLQWQLKVK